MYVIVVYDAELLLCNKLPVCEYSNSDSILNILH